jgi:FkbM family methyltransferase
MKILEYYCQLFKHSSFNNNFIKIFINAFILFFLLLLNIKYKFKINTVFVDFYLTFYPLKKKMGGRGIFIFREKIEPLMQHGLGLIKKNFICIDAGANQGIFSIPFAKIAGEHGKVIAIEPMKYAQEIIKNNARINNLSNIYVYNGVLSNKIGLATLDYTDGIGSSSILRDHGKKNLLEVNSNTIDNLYNEYSLNRVDFIKLDVEGAELLALKGAKNILEKFKPIICLECGVFEFDNINNFLKKIGYSSYIYSFSGNLIKTNKIFKDMSNVFFKI